MICLPVMPCLPATRDWETEPNFPCELHSQLVPNTTLSCFSSSFVFRHIENGASEPCVHYPLTMGPHGWHLVEEEIPGIWQTNSCPQCQLHYPCHMSDFQQVSAMIWAIALDFLHRIQVWMFCYSFAMGYSPSRNICHDSCLKFCLKKRKKK